MIPEMEMLESERFAEGPFEVPSDVSESFGRLLNSGSGLADDFVAIAQGFERFGLVDQAIEAYRYGLERDGRCLSAHRGRAEAFVVKFIESSKEGSSREFVEKALMDLEAAVVVSGCDMNLRCLQGTALLLLGEYDECRELLASNLGRAEVGGGGSVIDLLYLLGFCDLFAGKADSALSYFSRISETGGSVAEAGFGKAVCFLVCRNSNSFNKELGALRVRDTGLWSAAKRLSVNGCFGYLDVARAVLGL